MVVSLYLHFFFFFLNCSNKTLVSKWSPPLKWLFCNGCLGYNNSTESLPVLSNKIRNTGDLSSFILLGLCMWSSLFSSDHRFSVGLKPSYILGVSILLAHIFGENMLLKHSKTQTLLFFSKGVLFSIPICLRLMTRHFFFRAYVLGFACGLFCSPLDLCFMKTKWFQSTAKETPVCMQLQFFVILRLNKKRKKTTTKDVEKYSNGCPRDDVVPWQNKQCWVATWLTEALWH